MLDVPCVEDSDECAETLVAHLLKHCADNKVDSTTGKLQKKTFTLSGTDL